MFWNECMSLPQILFLKCKGGYANFWFTSRMQRNLVTLIQIGCHICGPAYDCIQFRWSLLSSCKRRSNWFVFRSELRIWLSLLHVNKMKINMTCRLTNIGRVFSYWNFFFFFNCSKRPMLRIICLEVLLFVNVVNVKLSKLETHSFSWATYFG